MDGSKGVGLGVAIAVLAVLTLLPFLLVFVFYTAAQIQAIATGLDFSSETLNVPLFLLLLVGTVAVLVAGMAGLVALIGRSLSPRRRREDEGTATSEISG